MLSRSLNKAMSDDGKLPISTRVPRPLWYLFKATCKANRLRVETGVEQALIAGLEKLGVEVPPGLFDEEKIEPSGPLMNA